MSPLNIEYTLYFGLNCERLNTVVSHADWVEFIREVIAPCFDAFTVKDAQGYWKGESEDSKVVTIIGSLEDAPIVNLIGINYCDRYAQDAVAITSRPIRFSLVGSLKELLDNHGQAS